MQFTASQEYVDLLKQAQDLMSHALPRGALDLVHFQAMRLLVAKLKQRRSATLKRTRVAKQPPVMRDDSQAPRQAHDSQPPRQGWPGDEPQAPRQRGESRALRERDLRSEAPSQQAGCGDAPASAPRQRDEADAPLRDRRLDAPRLRRQRGHVVAAVRRTVWSRDGSRCTYVDERGIRCRETAFLELHHLDPQARGGPDTAANLTLRCRVHNALAAEQDFGRDFMQKQREDRERSHRIRSG